MRIVHDEILLSLPKTHRTYSYKTTSLEEWTSILALADKWSFDAISGVAIEGLGTSTLDNISKIVHAHRLTNMNRPWVVAALRAVCARKEPLSYEEGRRIDFRTFVKIATARERYIREKGSGISRVVTEIVIGAGTVDIEHTATKDSFQSTDEIIRQHQTYYFTDYSHDTIVFLVSWSVRN